MNVAFFKNTSLSHFFSHTKHSFKILTSSTKPHIPFSKTHFRPYFPSPDKKVKHFTISHFPSSFFSSSSSSSNSPSPFWDYISKLRFVSWYLGMLNSHPFLTPCITSAIIYTAADLSSQTTLLPSSEPFDFMRTLRMGGYGLFIVGPTLPVWFNFVSRHFPKTDTRTIFKKMLMSQSTYGPFMTVIFFSSNAFLQGENSTEIAARLKRDFFPTMLHGLWYWPVCDFLNFKFVPVHLQPLVINSFAFAWSIYLTYMANLNKVAASS